LTGRVAISDSNFKQPVASTVSASQRVRAKRGPMTGSAKQSIEPQTRSHELVPPTRKGASADSKPIIARIASDGGSSYLLLAMKIDTPAQSRGANAPESCKQVFAQENRGPRESRENLTPASGRQDHTASPSASAALVSAPPKRPSHPASNVRDDAYVPLRGHETRRRKSLIWGQRQAFDLDSSDDKMRH
jgi:hypothetical protein